jgi:hypothetical protein
MPSSAIRVSAAHQDEFLERYLFWRESCDDVRVAYDNWRDAEPADRDGAFFAYCATLDREESAARDYRVISLRLSTRHRVVAPS